MNLMVDGHVSNYNAEHLIISKSDSQQNARIEGKLPSLKKSTNLKSTLLCWKL